MKELSKPDQDVLQLLSEGISDHEVCRDLRISLSALNKAVKRIEVRAAVESVDAGRFYERALKLRAESQNQALRARLHALMEILPQAVLIVDGRTGALKDFNLKVCEMFGYSSYEMERLTVEDLVPTDFRKNHPAFRIAFLTNTRKRQMGYHPPIFGLRKDGAQMEMAIALTSSPNDDDIMVICTERAAWNTNGFPAQAANFM